MGAAEFETVHARLRALLEPYAPPLFVTADGPMGYGLDMAPEGQRDPSTWFAGTRLGARYVSYYLMPIYVEPSLLDGVSPELRRRMQGKSCFNFTKVERAADLGARAPDQGQLRGDRWRPSMGCRKAQGIAR